MPKIIPPKLIFYAILTMMLLNWILPTERLIPFPFASIGAVLMLCGFWMARNIQARYKQVDTEIHTFKAPRKLITDGLFKYSRNPIYLGMFVFLLGFSFLLGSLFTILPPVIFFILINLQHVPFEEKMMEQTFGNDYLIYKSKVRRWV